MLAVFLLCAAFALSGATEPQEESGAEQRPLLDEVVSTGLDPMEEIMAAEQNKSIEESSEELLAEKTERLEEEESLDQKVAGGSRSRDILMIPHSRCPPGWSSYGYRCFKFFNSPNAWIDAEYYCLHFDANLASIHSSKEYSFVQDLVRIKTGEFTPTWIGGTDAVQPFLWLWSDGSRFDFQAWAPGEPNNYRGREYCVEMNHGAGYRWNDLFCERLLPFVCAI